MPDHSPPHMLRIAHRRHMMRGYAQAAIDGHEGDVPDALVRPTAVTVLSLIPVGHGSCHLLLSRCSCAQEAWESDLESLIAHVNSVLS